MRARCPAAAWSLALTLALPGAACAGDPAPAPPGPQAQPAAASEEGRWAKARERMVTQQLAARDITDERVLEAMGTVPRHLFVPESHRTRAYTDQPLPIGEGQTISQPYIVALMTQLADLEPGEKVLEVGTGSGYQAAVLAELGAEVYTIEIVEPLARDAAQDLAATGYDGVHTKIGDGYQGWPEHAPFAAVLVTAAPPEVPAPLKEQLEVGGRLVIPVGSMRQELRVIERTEQGYQQRDVLPVRFVPMTGEAQRQP